MVALKNGSVFFQTLVYMMNQSIIQEESYNYLLYANRKRCVFKENESNASKCYGMYGCFKLTAPWTSESRPVSLFPDDINQIEPRYPLYTRKNRHNPIEFDLNDYRYIEASGIDPMKPIYVISHGYMEGGGIHWILDMAQEFLSMEDCSVIVVDWHKGSVPPYTQAVANIRLVGAITAYLLSDIARYTGEQKLNRVHCIGHSLGAHMCGYVGYTLQTEFNLTLDRITGMDPAEPHFSKTEPPVRLDRSAARYVDIVHTDARQFIRGGLGIRENIGHVDYYPNGGNNQPGCGKTVAQYIKDHKGSFFRGVRQYLACNHMRAYFLFMASINPKCSFTTISCTSYEDFLSGKCFSCGKYGEHCIPFGFHGRKHYEKYWKRNGKSQVQYLITGDQKPYCRGHYLIKVKVSDNEASREHGGEIGQLMFTMHSTSDGKGHKTSPIGFISGYHEPGGLYESVVAGDEIKQLRAIEISWKYNSSIFNPLTWRLLSTPKIYLTKVTVESLELKQSVTVCPKDEKPLINGMSQLMISSYC